MWLQRLRRLGIDDAHWRTRLHRVAVEFISDDLFRISEERRYNPKLEPIPAQGR